MRHLAVGRVRYLISGSDAEVALAHALGSAFIELQQLEFAIISYLNDLAEGEATVYDDSFDVFASKTFGNLIREMGKHEFLKPLANEIVLVKESRDFFVHKFLFHRFGGELTSDREYEALIRDATSLGDLFSRMRTRFHDFMLQNAPLIMFAAKRDPGTGEMMIVESEFSRKQS